MLIRFLIAMGFISAASNLQAQNPFHVMFSSEPLPTWVNTKPSVYNLQKVNDRKAEGIVLDQMGTAAMLDATNAQFSYLYSGRLLFNDEAGLLLNKIADKVLADQPQVRKSLNICTYYTAGNDAVCFPNGFIVLELGLIAQLENEDQLAFVLCHEIAHYIGGDFAMSERPYNIANPTPEEQQYMDYLRHREFEADLLGFDLYKKAGYSVAEALRSFDVREGNHLVPYPIPFEFSFFTQGKFSYEQTLSIGLAYTDTAVYTGCASQNSFHSRKLKLLEYLKDESYSTDHLKASVEFSRLSDLVVYNCGLISLEMHQFDAALYVGYYLHERDSAYRECADILVAKAIYQAMVVKADLKINEDQIPATGIVKHGDKFQDLFSFHEEPKQVIDRRGYINQVTSVFDGMGLVDRALLCADWTWRCAQQYEAEKELMLLMCGNSIALANDFNLVPVDSLSNYPVVNFRHMNIVSTPTPTPTATPTPKKKNPLEITIDIKKTIGPSTEAVTQTKSEYKKVVDHHSQQLRELAADSSFRKFYQDHQYSFVYSASTTDETILTNNTTYVMNAQHIWLKERKRTEQFEIDEAKSISASSSHLRNLKASAKSSHINLMGTDPVLTDSFTLKSYNTYSLVSRAFSEIAQMEPSPLALPLAYRREVDSMIAVDSIQFVMTDIAITRQYKKVRDPWNIVPWIIIVPAAPFGLAYLGIKKNKYTYRQSTFFNLKDGRISHVWISGEKHAGTAAQSRPYYQRMFLSIAKRKKK